MGLHAHILQNKHTVSIALNGSLREAEFAQLRAIIHHYETRGCRKICLSGCQAPENTPQQEFSFESLTNPAVDLSIEFAPSIL